MTSQIFSNHFYHSCSLTQIQSVSISFFRIYSMNEKHVNYVVMFSFFLCSHTDPLNGDAASLYLHKPEEYKRKVSGNELYHNFLFLLFIKCILSLFNSFLCLDYVRRFATEEALRETEKKDDSSDSEVSDFSDDDEAKDMEL